ncbi:hypothetical protein Y032_0417g1106 [Ancylostoma ceylanicum]|nr:hypothetical protein Y032_0417g1106 [Ancylostoma ceylanicum]
MKTKCYKSSCLITLFALDSVLVWDQLQENFGNCRSDSVAVKRAIFLTLSCFANNASKAKIPPANLFGVL